MVLQKNLEKNFWSEAATSLPVTRCPIRLRYIRICKKPNARSGFHGYSPVKEFIGGAVKRR